MLDLFRSSQAGLFGRRQRRERGGRIPVTIVTGFLGAGKTTLVRRFLGRPDGQGTAVIVNEFGETGIDDALLRSSSESTTLLGNGCLCCNVRSDLQAAMHRLVAERERGAIPHFRRIVIETSGLADPTPILSTFATDRALGAEFHLETVVAVVGAPTAAEIVSAYPEARRQLMLADRIVVSKTDIAVEDAAAAVTAQLRSLNPRAAIVTAVRGELDPAWLTESATLEPLSGRGFIADAAEADHTDNVRSFTLTDEAPIAWDAFARTIELLIGLRGPDLLRVKGFLDVVGCRGPVVVQVVQHLAHPPVELEEWPGGRRASRVVFIVRGIGEREVRDLFAAVRALAKPT